MFFSAVTSVISITIFGFGLEQKPCMDRLPWNLMELIYPVFMVILLGCAAIGTDVHSGQYIFTIFQHDIFQNKWPLFR